MHQSFFTYNITKPYPYQWFTWLVVIGGIATTALFTVVNLAANGYDPSVVYSSNPNVTENPEHPAWYQKKPWSLTSKISSSCQSQAIDIGGQYYTNNFAFPYRIIGMHRTGESAATVSFAYHNDYIRACWVTQMLFTMNATTLPHVPARAFINCTMYDESSTVTMQLAVSTEFKGSQGMFAVPSADSLPQFLAIDNQTQAAITWGQHLSKNYFDLLNIRTFYLNDASALFNLNFSEPVVQDDTEVSSFLSFNEDIRSTKLRNEVYPLPAKSASQPGRMSATSWASTFGFDMLADYDPTRNVSSVDLLGLLFDGLAKSFYSTIMADLGQSVPSNIVASPAAVLSFAKKTCDVAFAINDDPNLFFTSQSVTGMCNGTTGNDPMQLFDFMYTGVPRVDPATISTRYLCQVPKLKSTGSLLISVIVADLVFLQVVWLVLNWITTVVVERQDPMAMSCSGITTHGTLRSLEEAKSLAVSVSEESLRVFGR